MDKLSFYRNLVKDILTSYCDLANQSSDDLAESLVAFDEVHDQYLWFQSGWQGKRRIRGVTVHIRIRNGKIWIEEDWTEAGIATALLQANVPEQDIVLGFLHPDKRALTEFSVA
jgi:hypothetical protein